LRADFHNLGEVRGAGLFIGLDIVEDQETGTPAPDTAVRIVNGLRDRHVLISATGPAANVLKIRPPLVFSRDNADSFIAALRATLAAL
jgi:4-aminobutyrate aminotransferase-like enzyme